MNVVLGIGGGIAAYKAAELARALMERGVSVQVVMTAAAQEFVRPLTFAALTGHKVITGMFAAPAGEDTLASAIEHIGVADRRPICWWSPPPPRICWRNSPTAWPTTSFPPSTWPFPDPSCSRPR